MYYYYYYYTPVLPILNYRSQVWLNGSSKIEKIHLQFCKKLLGVRQQTQQNFVHGEPGRTLKKKVINAIKYWLKVVQLDDIKYVKINIYRTYYFGKTVIT